MYGRRRRRAARVGVTQRCEFRMRSGQKGEKEKKNAIVKVDVPLPGVAVSRRQTHRRRRRPAAAVAVG